MIVDAYMMAYIHIYPCIYFKGFRSQFIFKERKEKKFFSLNRDLWTFSPSLITSITLPVRLIISQYKNSNILLQLKYLNYSEMLNNIFCVTDLCFSRFLFSSVARWSSWSLIKVSKASCFPRDNSGPDRKRSSIESFALFWI